MKTYSLGEGVLIVALVVIAFVLFQILVWSLLGKLGFNNLEKFFLIIGLNTPLNIFIVIFLCWVWYKNWRD